MHPGITGATLPAGVLVEMEDDSRRYVATISPLRRFPEEIICEIFAWTLVYNPNLRFATRIARLRPTLNSGAQSQSIYAGGLDSATYEGRVPLRPLKKARLDSQPGTSPLRMTIEQGIEMDAAPALAAMPTHGGI
ncbi:hypothetical protein C8R46DRAFT_1208239 [Mycena filopes]|nr:hypothetical protein C8R46DRAFT_1208239 [Mycena filopes]